MLSPFTPHLGTNYAPSELEKLQIKQLLEKPREELQSIDYEIEGLRQRLAALVHQREERAQFIEDHSTLLGPIRGLPNELLRTIFKSHDIDEGHMSAAEAPLLLTFVCQLWRRAALIPSPSQRSEEDWALAAQNLSELTRLWLSRARNRPITISISSSWRPHPGEGIINLLSSVAQYSSQWKELRVQAYSDVTDGLLSLPSSSVPDLQYLDNSDSGAGAFAQSDKEGLLGGPSLRGLRYRGFRLLHIAETALQWSQLTDLHIASVRDLADIQVWVILKRCPCLERCHARIASVGFYEPVAAPRPQLPCLKLLHIRHTTVTPLTLFFTSLHLPALADLTLYTPDSGESLSAAIGESAPTLRRLAVWTNHTSTETMLENLGLLSQLEFLELGYLPYRGPPCELLSDAFLAALTPSSDEDRTTSPNTPSATPPPPYLCPNLQEISLHVATAPRITDTVIFEFIKNRRGLRSPTLRSVKVIHPWCDAELDVVGELDKQRVDVRHVKVNLQYRERERDGSSVLDL
ncbi:hypothetical protein DFP72DRAFT_875891 [Ephemerocybe angulata]|uniref:F-box domain-containing protein n=1 Tax=Ephemerocybe angulata TaxID=980116 RepID=A0A8H6MBM5_9AGAR|nr:hypothetical protein DFP72DRAFT_875891 [Tulosesus angulatus]